MARLLLLLLLGTAMAFNNDDNEHGYTGRCPPDWRETDFFCFKTKGHERDFREALDECTSERDKYHTYWEQGARWVGPKYNLIQVEELHKLLEHGQGANTHLGRGPYRVNAIKTNHDHKWREYDGGEVDIDVYRWRGGREIDFSMFPEFDEEWGHTGDTLVWYPHSNKLYARPHYHKYDSLCVRRKEDAERCPGVPECNFHGDCYHGKCYCYKGYIGDDCKGKPKVLTCGMPLGPPGSEYCELFDFETMTSCWHSETPESFYQGQMAMISGDVFHCGGGDQDYSGPNISECWVWSCSDEDWIQRAIGPMYFPSRNADSVMVPGLGWWYISGLDGENGAGKEWWDTRTEFIFEDHRDQVRLGPYLPRNGTAEHNCAVQVKQYYTFIIGGEGPADQSGDTYEFDVLIFNWYRNDWTLFYDYLPQGFWKHECEVLYDPNCGHDVIALLAGDYDANGDYPDKVWLWDVDTDKFYTSHETPVHSFGGTNWNNPSAVKIDEETVLLNGGYVGGIGPHDGIYTYSIAEGWTHLGEMLTSRYQHSTVLVWGDEWHCPEVALEI